MKLWVKLIVYFRRGWGLVVVPVSVLNFLLISYRLLVEKVPALHTIFPTFTLYALFTVPIGVSLAILVGWWDYRRGTSPVEHERAMRFSPWHRDLMQALLLTLDGEHEKAKEILRKWL